MKTIACAIALLALSTAALAAEPVVPAPDQAALLASSDPHLAANKKLVFDMWRTLLEGHQLDQTDKFLAPEYHQHNPNAVTGRAGFVKFFQAMGAKPVPVPATIRGLVAMTAEGDLVTMATVRNAKDTKGQAYTTTWFDMFRISNGRIVEHWDCALKM
jgi:predicted SnoaL-like aldol condensation-catalyzing enzyme